MERLPDEVLLAVLERLSTADVVLRAARVCRRWRRLAASSARLVRGRRGEGGVGRGTRRLLVTARGASLPRLLAAAPLLTALTVHARVPLRPHELAALERLPHLRHLDVHAAGGRLGGAVLPAARRLTSLVLNDTPAPGLLRALAAGCRLRELHMYGRARYYPPRELAALLAARAPYLRELTLRCEELQDAGYRALARCGGLRALRLYACWQLRGGAAAGLALAGLHTLHVTGARMLRPAALLGWVRALPPGLRELALSAGWLGDGHVAALCARVPGLRVLEVWRCGVSAGGVRALAGGLRRLRELDVDVSLQEDDVAALARHGALRWLRCAGPGAGAGAAGRAGELRVESAEARVARGALRGGGEGPRAELFYGWSWRPRALPPHPPHPPHPPPADSDDDEEDYSLLGNDIILPEDLLDDD